MSINWSKVLFALERSPGCVDEEQHNKFLNLVLSDNIILHHDAFYYDNNIGVEDVWMSDTKLTHYSEIHKYALMQSKLWWNVYDFGEYPNVPNAKIIIMNKYPYMTYDICSKLENSRKFYRYR